MRRPDDYQGALMLDHIGLDVRSYAVTRAFYSAVLVPLGYGLVEELRGWGGFGPEGRPLFWIHESSKPLTPIHLAFIAPTRGDVDRFYDAAIAAGARDNGRPGLRAHYHPNYYGAFVLDPDGNNIEAVCHLPSG